MTRRGPRPERSYVVVWWRLDAGEPYVAAECAGREIAEEIHIPRARVLSQEEMEREPSLREALCAWERRNDEAWARDRERGERILAAARTVNARVAAGVEAILHGHPGPGDESASGDPGLPVGPGGARRTGGGGEKEASGMRILARCRSCDRDLLLDQLTESGAACPWCGAFVAADYVPLFVDAIRDAERAGSALVGALELLRDTGRGVRIDPGSILEPIRKALGPTEEEAGERSPARPFRVAA